MESRKLMSHSDYEDSIDLPTVSDSDYRTKSRNHRKFINEKLTLGMFVPTDEEGSVLEKPKNYDLWLKKALNTPYDLDLSKYEEYQKVLDNVVFEGVNIFIRNCGKHGISVETINYGYIFNSNSEAKNTNLFIEDLLKYELIITENAITKYQI